MTPGQIEQIIDMLVEKLGPIGEQVWSIYVRQVYVNAGATLVWAVALLSVAGIGVAIGIEALKRLRYQEKTSQYYVDADTYYAVTGMAWGFAGIALIFGFLALTAGLQYILNPEYYAIQMLLGK